MTHTRQTASIRFCQIKSTEIAIIKEVGDDLNKRGR